MGLRVGFVGWRGMVGSVLMDRMLQCNDFNGLEPVFFSTSNTGGEGPNIGFAIPKLADAYDVKELAKLEVIVTCQGGDYTQAVYDKLRQSGWQGIWIDAASTLRMRDDAMIILDPVNGDGIQQGLKQGVKTFVGGNCTVSLMLMAIMALFKNNLVEWLCSMTYQSASGAGAKNMQELVAQMAYLSKAAHPQLSALELDKQLSLTLSDDDFPQENFGAPLAANLIPWIDKAVDMGQTKEEWKGFVETNKILQTSKAIPVDGQCVRVGAMRCHSQALMIKLTRNVSLEEITAMISGSNEWVKVVPNTKEDTLKYLTPAAVSGTLTIPIGRLRKMRMGEEYLTAFTVGDQLLWGAAEPLRRMLSIVRSFSA